MPADNSFDVVSDFDRQEMKNALDQTRREVATRYDFRGATAEIEEEKEERPGRHENDDQASVKSLAGVDQLLPARSRTM